MRYVIVEDNRLKKVTLGIYERWLESNSDQFILPEFTKEEKNIIHTIDTDFVGFCESGHTAPFVLFHFENELTKNKKKLKKVVKDVIEHFETFEELKKRRDELIKSLSKN